MGEDLIDWSRLFREKGIVRGTIADPPNADTILWWNAEGDVVEEWKCDGEQDARARLAKHQAATGPVVSLDDWRKR